MSRYSFKIKRIIAHGVPQQQCLIAEHKVAERDMAKLSDITGMTTDNILRSFVEGGMCLKYNKLLKPRLTMVYYY